MTPEKARILLAKGMANVCIVLSTDSDWVAYDIDAVSNSTVDLGIDEPDEEGIWLWEGTLKVETYGPDSNEPETVYDMTSMTWVTDPTELLKMTPPYEHRELEDEVA